MPSFKTLTETVQTARLAKAAALAQLAADKAVVIGTGPDAVAKLDSFLESRGPFLWSTL